MAEHLRVVHLAGYGGAYSGSFIPMLEAARRATEARGWTFEAVFTHGAERHAWHGTLRDRGVRTHLAPPMGRRAATRWVHSLLSVETAPTLLHTHFSVWDLPATLAARARGPTSVIWHLHTRLSDEALIRATNLVRFGLIGRFVDRLLCVAPEIREKAVARLAPAGRTEVFPNAIDVSRFRPVSPVDRGAARAQLNVPANRPVLLLFAWDWETKGGHLLIETLRELHRRGREVHAILVGSEERARDEARRLDLDEAIHPIPFTEDTPGLYGAADVFIAASIAEGMPFALLEALGCGTPVVASDIAGHRFAGAALPACRLVPRLPTAFADAVAAELDARVPDRCDRLADTRAVIERDFSLEPWAERLIRQYEQLLPH